MCEEGLDAALAQIDEFIQAGVLLAEDEDEFDAFAEAIAAWQWENQSDDE